MNKTRTVSVSQEKAGQKKQMSLQQALDSFKRISDKHRVLALRKGRREIEEDVKDRGGDLEVLRSSWPIDPEARCSDEELEEQIRTESSEYNEFWADRLKDVKLFADGRSWVPGYEGLAIKKEEGRNYFLIEPQAEMLMMLSETPTSLYEKEALRNKINLSYMVNSNLAIGHKLIDRLHVEAVARFVQSLEGEQISKVLQSMGYQTYHQHSEEGELPFMKILWSLERAQIEKLAVYCATESHGLRAFSEILEQAGEEGKAVLRRIAHQLQVISKNIEKQLDCLMPLGW